MSHELLQVQDLRVSFAAGGQGLTRKRRVRAVNGVSFGLGEGETLGLVGESGSGKSTLARAVLRLVGTDAGHVTFRDRSVTGASRRELRAMRRDMQMVFQDPYSSLDPSMTVRESIGEPLRVHDRLDGAARRKRTLELLDLVGCSPHHADRYPHEFSGGQRQRIAIARAMALNPSLLICDEAVSALDVSTRNQVITLLEQLRAEFGLSFLFIAHDLSLVRHISQRVAVMYLGKLVEIGDTARVYGAPAHPYTQALLSAVPVPGPDRRGRRERIVLEGDIPDPANPPRGCPFHTRCAYAMDICRTTMPDMTPVEAGGTVACHLQTSGPELAGAPLKSLEPTDVPEQHTSAAGPMRRSNAGTLRGSATISASDER